jgi:MFS transporter, SP family, general alpha glucoside:H+ symporter
MYPKAGFWSAVVSLVVIMDGYETALIRSLQGFPAFRLRFGILDVATNTYQIQAKWQETLGLASPLGNVVGIFINGVLTERFGHKKPFWRQSYGSQDVSSSLFSPLTSRFYLSESSCVACLGESSPPWLQHMLPKSLPVALRAYLETFVVLGWGIDQLISYGVLDGLDTNLTNWAWRIPFAVQWVWPVIIIRLSPVLPGISLVART